MVGSLGKTQRSPESVLSWLEFVHWNLGLPMFKFRCSTTEWNRFLFMSLEFVYWNLGKKLVHFMIHFNAFLERLGPTEATACAFSWFFSLARLSKSKFSDVFFSACLIY